MVAALIFSAVQEQGQIAGVKKVGPRKDASDAPRTQSGLDQAADMSCSISSSQSGFAHMAGKLSSMVASSTGVCVCTRVPFGCKRDHPALCQSNFD
jgi:hypothetical protein